MIWHIIALALIGLLGVLFILAAAIAWATVAVGSALDDSWDEPVEPAESRP